MALINVNVSANFVRTRTRKQLKNKSLSIFKLIAKTKKDTKTIATKRTIFSILF